MRKREDILNKKIIDIYYTPQGENSSNTVFIDLENETRFVLNSFGISFLNIDNFDDLYAINFIEAEKKYRGIKIVGFEDLDSWIKIMLENGSTISVHRTYIKGLFVDDYNWQPKDGVTNRKAPEINLEEFKYDKIISLFNSADDDIKNLYLNILNELHTRDKIQILQKLYYKNIQNKVIIKYLALALAENNEKEEALWIVSDAHGNNDINFEEFQNLKQEISLVTPNTIKSYKEIKDFMGTKIYSVNSFEKLFAIVVNKFIEKNYNIN